MKNLTREKDVIGIFLSAHPLDDYKLEMESFCNVNLSDLHDLKQFLGKEVILAGMVTEARSGTSRNGKPYGSITIQDYTDSYRFMLFDKDYVEHSKYFTPGYFVLVKGMVQKRMYKEDEIEVKIKKINLLTSVREEMIKSLSLIVPVSSINNKMVDELKDLTTLHKGKTELKFVIIDPVNKISLPMFSRSVRVDVNNNFINFIKAFPGIEYKVN